MHRDLPGHTKILEREYTLVNEQADGTLITRESWDDMVKEGTCIGLNIILRKQFSSAPTGTSCPRCNKTCTVILLPGQQQRW